MASPTAEAPGQQAAAMQTDGVDPDMHHRAFFSFEPTLFLADLGNIVSCAVFVVMPLACLCTCFL
jgi:hypothetical protein